MAVARDRAGLKEAQPSELRPPGGGPWWSKPTWAPSRAHGAAAAHGTRRPGGTIDILVNNAGIAVVEPILETTAEDWDLVQAVNLRAPFLLAQALAPGHDRAAPRQGSINVSSQTSGVTLTGHAAYAASKNGLNALTKVMTAEWALLQCSVETRSCPTVILTPMGEQVWGDPARGDPMRAARLPPRPLRPPNRGRRHPSSFSASPASDLITGEDYPHRRGLHVALRDRCAMPRCRLAPQMASGPYRRPPAKKKKKKSHRREGQVRQE